MPSASKLALVESHPGDEPDAALVHRTRLGDGEAFATIYERHRAEIYSICLKRLKDPSLADDAVQETFLRAYSCLDRFDPSRRIVPWLVTIAVRRCADLVRDNAKMEATDEIEAALPGGVPGEDPTLATVLAGEESRRLERALRRLAPRQRRALLLYALEDWTYADIAAAEGISVTSTKSLLFHARNSLRRACRRGLLGTILLPVRGLRRRIEYESARVRVRFAMLSDPLLAVGGNAVASAITAIAVAIAIAVPHGAPMAHGDSRRDSTPIAVGAPGASTGGQPLRLVAAPGRALADSASGLGRSLVDPTHGATPEDTVFTSITPSPEYQRDKTVFAAGIVPCAQPSCPILWRSGDGGATWQRLPAAGFNGRTILLPPSYPADSRIFAMGSEGLQVSKNGGATFDVVLPLEGGVAISPEFSVDDPRILIGHGAVVEYWPDKRRAKPASLVGPAWPELTIAFSPAYGVDRSIFLGGAELDDRGRQRPVVYHCAASMCDSLRLPKGSGIPTVRLSPNFESDRQVFAFTFDALHRSSDGGASYEAASLPGDPRDYLRDIAIVTGSDGVEFTYAAVTGSGGSHGGVFRSGNDGTSWIGGSVALDGFGSGATLMAPAWGGRLFAAGALGGIACSSDSGRTWNARCAS